MSAKHFRILTFLFISIIFGLGCKSNDDIPDISNVKADGKFNVDFLYILGQREKNTITDKLMKADKTFLDIYIHEVIFPGDSATGVNAFIPKFEKLTDDTLLQGLEDTLHLAYDGVLSDLDTDFRTAFRYLKFYFPEYKTPNVYLCNTLFNYQKFIFQDEDGRDGIALGGEMFLNDFLDYKAFDPTNPAYSDYLTRTFNREHLVKKALDLVVDELTGPPAGGRLIDYMIHNGKKLYLLEQLLPYASDTIIHEYSPPQMKWCQENELEMWGFFLEEKLFYESAPMKIVKYISDSPNSPGMPDQAPGRVANYLGLQIVKKFVSESPGMDLQELMSVKDAQMILDKSKYKPARK